ncbi:MAG: PadR family transcriptional regulator [Corynebacterium sp.]|nr:PadR family transcriptional regulator [Corynebacterium sp.]
MSIKHSLLELLLPAPASASQLQERFDKELCGQWPLNIGQVAQTLDRLERDGFITPAGTTTGPTGRQSELYAISPAGREELQSWWDSPINQPPNKRDELVIKLSLAAQHPAHNFVSILDNQRFSTLRQLRLLNERAAELPADRSAPRLDIERRIFELEATLRWLDRIEALPSSDSPLPNKDN